MFVRGLLVVIYGTLLSGCVAMARFDVLGLFDGYRLNSLVEAQEPDEVVELLEWAIVRLDNEDESDPALLAKLIPAVVDKLLEKNQDSSMTDLQNTAISGLLKIASNGVKTEDPEDWEEKGFPYDVTSDYLRASAISNVTRLDGKSLSTQLLVLLGQLDSAALQAVILDAINERIDSYLVSDEIRTQTLVALSNIKVSDINSNDQLKLLVFEAESKLVDHSVINRAYRKSDVYQLSDRNLLYLMDLNKRYFDYLFDHVTEIDVASVQENALLLSKLALPQKDQLDGLPQRFSEVEKQSQQILLNYLPGLYYFSMLDNAKLSDFSLAQLVVLRTSMSNADAAARSAKDSVVVTSKQGAKFFNHRILMNKKVFSKTAQGAAKLIFGSLESRVVKRPLDYVEYVFSHAAEQYPIELKGYFLGKHRNTFVSSGVDALKDFYSLRLSTSKQLTQKDQKKLANLVVSKQFERTLKYTESGFSSYVDKVHPLLVDLYSTSLLYRYQKAVKSVHKQKGAKSIVDFYIAALDRQELKQRKKFLSLAGELISFHDKAVTFKLMGAMRQLPLDDTVAMFTGSAFRKVSDVKSEEWIFLGNYLKDRSKELSKRLDKNFGSIFLSAITNAKVEDESSLTAAQQATLVLDASAAQAKQAAYSRFRKREFL